MIEEDYDTPAGNSTTAYTMQSENFNPLALAANDNNVESHDDDVSQNQYFNERIILKKFWKGNSLSQPEKSMLMAALIIGIGGFIFGYELGAICGTIIQLRDHFNLKLGQEGVVIGAMYFGQVCGGFFGGFASDGIGRWHTSVLQSVFFAVGSIVLATATTFRVLICGRFFIGVAAAFATVSALPYLREIGA